MTTSIYLDSVVKILPAVQARNITNLLNDLKVKGEIRDADEYRAKLQELATLINDKEPKPSFERIRSLIWHLTSSDGHNTMMQSTKGDLDAIFQQVDEVGRKINDHHFLIMKSLAADLERGLSDQENTISRLEWLANQNNEFSIALINSFSSASLFKVSRSETDAENLYFDNRTYQNRTESELPSTAISEHSQKMFLGVTNEPQVLPISARLHTDESSYGTQLQVDIDNDISNIIDGQRGTYWTRNVYLSDNVPKVTTVLELDLGTAKDISYVIVEGATEIPFLIDEIKAIAPDGHKILVASNSVKVDGWIRIDFDRVLARAVQITFSMQSYIKVDYFTDPKNEIWKAFSKDGITYSEMDLVEMFGPLATEVLSFPSLAKILNVPSGDSTMTNAYLYPFALDNIWFGNGIYEDSGIFVSKPLKGQNFGVCAVQTQEIVSTLENTSNSIEYEIIKKDLTPKYKETRFPIPRLKHTTITAERLILTKRIYDSTQNDAGALRFCPYVASDWELVDGNPVKVYKNGEELDIGVVGGFEIAISLNLSESMLVWVPTWNDGLADATEFSKYTLRPQKMWIKISQPDPTAVYTVSYTAHTGDTYIDNDTVWLDKDQTVFLTENGRVCFRRDNPDIVIDSELYLQITMRRNTASQSSTPELDKYALLGATYN